MKYLIALLLLTSVAFADEQTAFTSFEMSNPVVKPAEQEKVYDKMWMKSFFVVANSPQDKAVMEAVFVPYDGQEIAPNAQPIFVRNDNLFALAGEDQDIAMAMELTFRALKKLGIQQGVFKAPTPVDVDENNYGAN